jgi:murein DD-endopeptidase MepM/ murein hydrolase activator NlpD
MKSLHLAAFATAALLLAACGAAQPAVLTPTFSPVPPSETPSPQPTATATPEPSPTPWPVSAVCSPLQDHALTDLRKYMTQPFIPPVGENKETGHHGVDFAYYHRDGVGGHIDGTPIQSVMNGWMAGLGYNPVYGNYLVIETPADWMPADVAEIYGVDADQSLYLLYAHMQDLAPFEIHEPIDCGQVVGLVGNSGDPYFVSDPHLHFETRVGPADYFVEPMSFYDTQASEAEKAEYMKWRSSGFFELMDPMLLLDYGASQEETNG